MKMEVFEMKRSELKRVPTEQLMDFCDGEMNELRFSKRKLIRIAELRPECGYR